MLVLSSLDVDSCDKMYIGLSYFAYSHGLKAACSTAHDADPHAGFGIVRGRAHLTAPITVMPQDAGAGSPLSAVALSSRACGSFADKQQHAAYRGTMRALFRLLRTGGKVFEGSAS